MGYILIDNFGGGVDRSRPRYASSPGTLWSGINGHLSRGGDFEKCKAWVEFATLPPGTVGLSKTATGLVTFGSAPAPLMPAGVAYQRLQHPTLVADLPRIRSWDLYNGQVYAVAEFSNGDTRHYYNGVNVADWNAGVNKPVGWGSIVRTHKRKVYSPIGSVQWFSALDSATVFDSTATGSGFQNMSTHQSGSDRVTALSPYQQFLAVFAPTVIQIWDMQDNSASNAPVQIIGETGSRSPRACLNFGDMDTFYLSDSGVRSLRARQGTAIAGVNDVGTPIDTLLREYADTLTNQQFEDAIAIVEPVDGRFWIALGARIFVFTYFPSKKISGWSWYEPGLTFTDMVSFNRRIYARAGNAVYVYGGADGEQYTERLVTCALPFLSGGKPGTYKNITGLDIAAQGDWDCEILINPRDEAEFIKVGALSGVTFNQQDTGALGHVTHIAPVLRHQGAGKASVSQITIHNDAAESPP